MYPQGMFQMFQSMFQLHHTGQQMRGTHNLRAVQRLGKGYLYHCMYPLYHMCHWQLCTLFPY